MLEVIKRYSEDAYYRKQDFIEMFDASTAHVLWDETMQYRNQFRYDINIANYTCFIILCRNVMFSLLRCERKLYQYCEQDKSYEQSDRENNAIWNSIEFKFASFGCDALHEWLNEACLLLGITDVSCCEYLLTFDGPVLLKIFLCFHMLNDHHDEMIRLLLLKENKSAIMRIISTHKRSNGYLDVCTEDITYDFLKFIEHIELKLSQGMVLLKQTCERVNTKMDVMELSQCYPQLSIAQLTFYGEHKMVNHYYTIQHFMNFTNVCYETARGAMDMFVAMHWYQKRKLGKKFVYFIYE